MGNITLFVFCALKQAIQLQTRQNAMRPHSKIRSYRQVNTNLYDERACIYCILYFSNRGIKSWKMDEITQLVCVERRFYKSVWNVKEGGMDGLSFPVQTSSRIWIHFLNHITWLRMYLSMPVSFFPSVLESVGLLFMDGVLRQDLSEHWRHRDFHKTPQQQTKKKRKLKIVSINSGTHLFTLLGTCPDVTRGGAVLPQAVHRLTVHELDSADQTGTGAAVVLVAAWVAEVYVGTDEALLVAQQDHNLCRERGEGGASQCTGRKMPYAHIHSHTF